MDMSENYQPEEYNEEEGLEEGVVEEELLDEQVEDDGEYEEQIEDESDGEIVDAPDDFQVEIPVRQLDGTYKEEVFDQESLAHVVSKGQHFDELLQQAQALQQQVSQSKALVDFVARDPVLSRMTYMKANGYTEQEILNDLQQIVNNMNQNQTDPYLDELDDTQKQIYLKVKEEEQRRIQLEGQLQALQNERMTESIATHNSKVFDDALAESGLNYTGEADIPKIQKAIADLYPNVDPRSFKFNKQQAQAILRYAGLGKRGSATSTKIQQVNKAKAAPRVVGGSKSSGTNKRQVQQKLGNTVEERRKALLALGL